ncbi:NAD(P)-dependent oxidoreductase [Salipiger sp. PrR002]|uniref:NAD-dependent epimerase/dehydratase family protein n=1 Tax=Salipiger sp. PrR002 TaxID=2706489 RepID=UPI0013B7D9F2|nr:NAD-dependent epimerase/dehydratase family protein [Salipiger sp. PrR002]NDW00682.1 NAD-dependent epimerase/dehydratase family protein [Salipiger sp. PrR002]NDW57723.1 NAD-dependent epimerase/dehydratase family protein [Salipiger sp. PrR004]
MRIYVTGCAGILGYEILCRMHAEGHEVTGISRSALPEGAPALPHVQVSDALHPGWLAPGDEGATIVHCAGLSDARRRFDSIAALNREVTEPQTDFVEALLARGWRGHLVYLSTAAVYGDTEDLPIAETREPQPKGYYALHKLSVENALLFLAAQHGFRLTLLRLGNPYGTAMPGRERGVMRLLLDALATGAEFTVYGSGETSRDYLHMDDFTRAVSQVVTRDLPEQITRLNLGAGEGTTLNGLIARMEAATGRSLNLVSKPSDLEVKSSVLDITRVRQLLGWSPQVSLDDGLARMVSDYGL